MIQSTKSAPGITGVIKREEKNGTDDEQQQQEQLLTKIKEECTTMIQTLKRLHDEEVSIRCQNKILAREIIQCGYISCSTTTGSNNNNNNNSAQSSANNANTLTTTSAERHAEGGDENSSICTTPTTSPKKKRKKTVTTTILDNNTSLSSSTAKIIKTEELGLVKKETQLFEYSLPNASTSLYSGTNSIICIDQEGVVGSGDGDDKKGGIHKLEEEKESVIILDTAMNEDTHSINNFITSPSPDRKRLEFENDDEHCEI